MNQTRPPALLQQNQHLNSYASADSVTRSPFTADSFYTESSFQPVVEQPTFLPPEVQADLIDFAERLEVSSIDFLSTNASAVRARFQEVADLLPEEVSDAITPAVFMEFHRSAVRQSHRRINDRLQREEIMKSITDVEAYLQRSSDQLEALLLRPEQLHQILERLKQEQSDLRAALKAKDKEVVAVEAPIAAIPAEVD